jgi:hypothetical protein
MPALLGFGLCEPAGLRSCIRVEQGTENPDEIGRERKRDRTVPAQAEGYALGDLQPTVPGSPCGGRAVVDRDDGETRNATDRQAT